MIKILNEVHNIVFLDKEIVPDRLQGHRIVSYDDETDMIAIAGWKDLTGQVADVIATYLELLPEGRREALEYASCMRNDEILRLFNVLEIIVQIKSKKERGRIICSA